MISIVLYQGIELHGAFSSKKKGPQFVEALGYRIPVSEGELKTTYYRDLNQKDDFYVVHFCNLE
jgi:hypothetical protein